MPSRTISSREFNQDASGAKRAAADGPVFITDRGRPAHVLLTYENYQALIGEGVSLLDAVGEKEPTEFEFDPPRMRDGISRLPDL